MEERTKDIGELKLEACDSPSYILNLFGKTLGLEIQLSDNV